MMRSTISAPRKPWSSTSSTKSYRSGARNRCAAGGRRKTDCFTGDVLPPRLHRSVSGMGQHDLLTRAAVQRLGPHWRGHAFLFEAKSPPGYDSSTGLRLLLIFLLLEGVIGPRWSLLGLLHLAVPPSWIRVPILLGLALMLLCFFGRL